MLTPTNVTAADFNSAALANAVSHIKMTFTGQNITLTDDDIESSGLQLNQYLNSDTDLTFGKTAMYNLSVNILNSTNLSGIAWDGEFKLEIGLEVNNSTEYITLGYFTGERPEKVTNVEVISFKANDRMQKFDVLAEDWINSLTFPKTVKQLYDSLCSYVGVSNESGDELANIMSRSFSSSPFASTGITCRRVLGAIAEAAGCYAKIAANGKCKLVWFSNQTSYAVTGDEEFSSDAFDVALADVNSITKVKALTVKQTEDDTGVTVPQAESSNVYMIVDNPFLSVESASDTTNYITPIYTRLDNFGGYLPANVECIGNVLVEAGDIITVDVNGQSVPMPIFTKLLIWKGHCVDRYEATGNMKRRNVTEENKEKLATGGRYHKFRADLDGLYSELYDPVTGDINVINSSIGDITLSVAKKARIYYASSAPAGTVSDPLVTGDLWIDTGHNKQLKRWDGASWVDASFDDPDKYTVRSGIDINANGVEITGSKYLKLYSGGVLDVQATNFAISSADKKLTSDVWTIDPSGIRMEDTDNSEAFQIKTYGNTGHVPVINLDTVYDKFVGIRASYTLNDPVRLILQATDTSVSNNEMAGVSLSKQALTPPGSSILRSYAVFEPYSDNITYGTILGKSSNPFSTLYSNYIRGNCVQNNLTTENDGYVLDARQGKVLNDKIATEYKNSDTIANIQSWLVTLGNSMELYQVKNIRFLPSSATGVFTNVSYIGTICKYGTGYYSVNVIGNVSTAKGLIQGNYQNGTWTWNSINNQIGNIQQSQFTCLKNGGKLRFSCSNTTSSMWMITAFRGAVGNDLGSWLAIMGSTSALTKNLCAIGANIALAFDSGTNKLTLTNSDSSNDVYVSVVRLYGTGTLTVTQA